MWKVLHRPTCSYALCVYKVVCVWSFHAVCLHVHVDQYLLDSVGIIPTDCLSPRVISSHRTISVWPCSKWTPAAPPKLCRFTPSPPQKKSAHSAPTSSKSSIRKTTPSFWSPRRRASSWRRTRTLSESKLRSTAALAFRPSISSTGGCPT